jgi:hypothetical protein
MKALQIGYVVLKERYTLEGGVSNCSSSEKLGTEFEKLLILDQPGAAFLLRLPLLLARTGVA